MADARMQNRDGFPVWSCDDCGRPNDLLIAVCRTCGGYRPCDQWKGDSSCGSREKVHMYLDGPKCSSCRRPDSFVIKLVNLKKETLA